MSDVTHGTPFSVVPLCSTGLEVTTLLTEGPLQWRALVRWHDGESFIGPHQTHHCPLLAARTTLCWALRHTHNGLHRIRLNENMTRAPSIGADLEINFWQTSPPRSDFLSWSYLTPGSSEPLDAIFTWAVVAGLRIGGPLAATPLQR